MGEAKRRGTFEERRAKAIEDRSPSWRRRNARPPATRGGMADPGIDLPDLPQERPEVVVVASEPTERDMVMARLSAMGFNRGVGLIAAPGRGGDRHGR